MTNVTCATPRSDSPEDRSTDDMHALFARRFGDSKLDVLFPVQDRAVALAGLVAAGAGAFDPVGARFGNVAPDAVGETLVDFGSGMPEFPAEDADALVESIATTFLSGAVDWRNSSLQVNVGAPPTLVASALYALGLDANVNLVNDGVAGRVIEAEGLVSDVLSTLAGVPEGQARGLFVFGGTGTIMYGIRCGLAKATPDIESEGVSKDCFVAITEEAHFSHARSSRWLGLGDNHIVSLPSDEHRVTRFEDARELIETKITAGCRLAALVLNGGTTYDHSVDDVARFRHYIDDLVQRYDLDYRPHIHVDSVIGWEWLFFRNHTFTLSHEVAQKTQHMLLEQAALVTAAIQNADSWGWTSTKVPAAVRSTAVSCNSTTPGTWVISMERDAPRRCSRWRRSSALNRRPTTHWRRPALARRRWPLSDRSMLSAPRDTGRCSPDSSTLRRRSVVK